MEVSNLRYIVFLIDSRIKEHDGKIFANYNDAKEYAQYAIKDSYSNKFIIGMFYLDKDMQEMSISLVETFGFTGDKKNPNQMRLFTK